MRRFSSSQSPRRSTKRALALALLIVLTMDATACSRGPRVAIIGPDGSPRASVTVEIAANPAARETGLMYRTHLARNAGMIFVFPDSSQLDFWMKNTPIPLDMIFAGSDGRIIGIVANAQPYGESMLRVPGKSQYVLEVNAGFSADHGIKAGDRFEFSGQIPRTGD